jgi:cell division initiation protein
MKLTPIEIKNKRFATKLRGYDPSEVTSYLESVAAMCEEIQKQNARLNDRIVELETKLVDYTSMEKAIQQTFMQAQETGGKAVENSRKEAQLIIHEAELKATQILDKARTDLTTVKEQVTILKARKDSIVTRLKMLLNSELDLIKALEVDESFSSQNGDEIQREISKEKTEIEEILKNLE